MRIARSIRSIVCLTLFVGTVLVHSNLAMAVEPVKMKAELKGKGKNFGQATFQMTEKHRSLELKINSVPGTTFIVAVHRGKFAQKLGWIRTDKFGHGWLYLDTTKGDLPPIMHDKDMIKLWRGNESVMFGYFESTRPNNFRDRLRN